MVLRFFRFSRKVDIILYYCKMESFVKFGARKEVLVMQNGIKYVKKIIPLLAVPFFLAALVVFYNEIRGMTLDGLRASLREISWLSLLFSFSAVVFNFWLHTIIEKNAVREVGLKIPYGITARISFVSRAIGSGIGVGAISGASVRLRYYSRIGAGPAQVARIVAVTQLSLLAGASLLNGLVLLFWPREIVELIRFPSRLRFILAMTCLAIPLFFVLIARVAKNGRDFSIRGRLIPIPEPKVIARQLTAGFCGPLASAMILFLLLPPSHGTNFFILCGTFALASIAGALSMVPLGIGVFEASLLWMLHPFYGDSELLSALLLYRLFNNLLPFLLALMLLVYDVFKPCSAEYCFKR